MDNQHDLKVILASRVPIIVVETHDERRFLQLLRDQVVGGFAGLSCPLFRWTITDGPQRVDVELDPQQFNAVIDSEGFDLKKLAGTCEGFSGAEIEQGIVAALYSAHADGTTPSIAHIAAEFQRTRPLSVVMAEQIQALRNWAANRTVPAD